MNMLRTFAAGTILGVSVLAAGCQYERSTAIPAAAVLAVEGQNSLTYRAGEDGTVYVFNRNANETVFTGQLRKGEAITVDPAKNQIMLEDRIVGENTLHRGDNYRIFFASEDALKTTSSKTTM